MQKEEGKCENKECSKLKLKDAGRIIKKIISKFKVNHSCKAGEEVKEYTIELLKEHMFSDRCAAYKPVSCPHERCSKHNEKTGTQTLKEHMLSYECEQQLLPCQKCNLKYKKGWFQDSKSHMCQEVIHRQLKAMKDEI